jgi:hypothetical protein
VTGTEDAVSSPEATNLRPDDRERMQRLSEEVQGRLVEMALITTRTLGVEMETGPQSVRFVPVQLPSGEPGGLSVEILERADGPNCMCYIDPPGVCQPCQVDPIKILP